MVAAIGAGAAATTAATSIGSSLAGSSTQSSDISAGQAQANAAEKQALAQYTTNATPFISTGTNALSGLADASGLNGTAGTANALSSFTASPGFQYTEQQALSGLDNGAASTGTLRDGNTVRAEEGLSANLANQDFSQYVNRLTGLVGPGLTATNSLGSAGLSAASNIANTDASDATAQANIAGNAAKGVGSAVAGLVGNASVQNALSGLGAAPQSAGEKALVGAAGG